MELRDNQNEAIEGIRCSASRGNKNILLHAATGFGKTVVASGLISLASQKGNPSLFLANRRELIYQAKRTINEFGIDAGVIMAGVKSELHKDVQIASMQTYGRRIDLDELICNPWFHRAKMIIVDEAHGSISPSYQSILKNYKGNALVVGLTATPCRGDGRPLGEFYDDMVKTDSIGSLIKQKQLVPVRYYCPTMPDLAKIRTVRGDYDNNELAKRMDKKKLVGDIVENWLRICPDRQTIVFAVNVKHSIHIVESFQKVGIRAEHIDANTPKEERQAILDRLKSGITQIVSNVGILTEGFDFPGASCIVLAVATKSLGRFIQMGGRGLRIYEGKEDCIMIDHGGCVYNHGRLEWEREWSLDGEEKAWKEVDLKKKDKEMLQCRSCNQVYSGQVECPDCGTEPKKFGKVLEVLDAELKALDEEKASVSAKRVFLGMLKCHIPRQKNSNPKRIMAMFRTRYKIWPHSSYKDVAPIEPDQAFLSYVKSMNIRFAKSKKLRER